MEKIAGIPILISIFSMVVCYLIVSSNINHWIKTFIMIGITLISFFIWYTIPSFMGYATVKDLPEEWVLVWGNVEKPRYIELVIEPYQPLNDNNNFLSYKRDSLEKRFYRCAYNEALDQALGESMEKASKGIKVIFRRAVQNIQNNGGGSGSGGRGKGEFVPHDDLPPGRMPTK